MKRPSLKSKKEKKYPFCEEKSLVRLTPDPQKAAFIFENL